MDEFASYYDLMELTPEASSEDIRSRYLFLKDLYEGDSIEIRAFNDEYSEKIRIDYLMRLDEAYEKLSEFHRNKKADIKPPGKGPDDEFLQWLGQIECFTGPVLRSVRERMGVDLKTIFNVTRIQPQFLEDVENEAFDSFPAEIYLRSYLIEYARFLSLDPQRILNDYLPRYRASRENSG